MSEHDHGFSRREDHCFNCGRRLLPNKKCLCLQSQKKQIKHIDISKIDIPKLQPLIMGVIYLLVAGAAGVLTCVMEYTKNHSYVSSSDSHSYDSLAQDYSISQDIRWAPLQASSSVIGSITSVGSVTQGSSVSLPWTVIVTEPYGRVQRD